MLTLKVSCPIKFMSSHYHSDNNALTFMTISHYCYVPFDSRLLNQHIRGLQGRRTLAVNGEKVSQL